MNRQEKVPEFGDGTGTSGKQSVADHQGQMKDVLDWDGLGLQAALVAERCRRGHITSDDAMHDLMQRSSVLSRLFPRAGFEAANE